MDDENSNEKPPPKCHFRHMEYDWADDGCQQVEFWICSVCGHTKEICTTLAG